MIFSRTLDYALRAAVALAHRYGTPATTRVLATDTEVPAAYLNKVLGLLAKAGVVHSVRGVGGGHTLARPPAKITLLDVLHAIEDRSRIHACPLGYATPGGMLCAMHARIDQTVALIERQFAAVTLGQVVASPTAPALCPLRKGARKQRR
jgi:Rrf2 family protein